MSEWKEYRLEKIAQLEKDSWKVGDEELPYIALEHIVQNGDAKWGRIYFIERV